MKPAKAMTIRLSEDQADALETIAIVENKSISSLIRAAISEHIETIKKDDSFKRGLKERINKEKLLLK